MENNTLSLVNENQQIVDGIINAGNEIFHSFPVDNPEDKVKLYNATSSEGSSLKSMINKIISVYDVVIMPVDVLDEKSGGTSTVPRTTFITDKGDFITATSWGVYNSVKKLAAIFGGLHFENGIKMTPVEVKTKNGFTINLKLV